MTHRVKQYHSRYRPRHQEASVSSGVGTCVAKGCDAEGKFPAPVSRENPRLKQYFCLEHIRAFNASWDFFADASTEEIENFYHGKSYGHRPTRPMTPPHSIEDAVQKAAGSAAMAEAVDAQLKELFGAYASDISSKETLRRRLAQEKAKQSLPPEAVQEGLRLLGISHPTDDKIIKKTYKALAKQTHPDLNKGSADAFSKISVAYHLLLDYYS
jgi:protoporphyrinogen oxidase